MRKALRASVKRIMNKDAILAKAHAMSWQLHWWRSLLPCGQTRPWAGAPWLSPTCRRWTHQGQVASGMRQVLVEGHMLTSAEEAELRDLLRFRPQDRWLQLLYRRAPCAARLPGTTSAAPRNCMPSHEEITSRRCSAECRPLQQLILHVWKT